ncbi:MAG: VanZ family protein [Flavobacteriales bacterium]|nr:VanZ family protein [Flavobacteriales bacterium]
MAKSYKLTVLIAVIIVVLSLMHINNLPKVGVKAIDKIGHFLAYFGLFLVAAFETMAKFRWSNVRYRSLIVIFILCSGFGVLMEVLQAWLTTYRHFDYLDMTANMTGAGIGFVFFSIGFKTIKKNWDKFKTTVY